MRYTCGGDGCWARSGENSAHCPGSIVNRNLTLTYFDKLPLHIVYFKLLSVAYCS